MYLEVDVFVWGWEALLWINRHQLSLKIMRKWKKKNCEWTQPHHILHLRGKEPKRMTKLFNMSCKHNNFLFYYSACGLIWMFYVLSWTDDLHVRHSLPFSFYLNPRTSQYKQKKSKQKRHAHKSNVKRNREKVKKKTKQDPKRPKYSSPSSETTRSP
jgi:hypothetical protein